MDFEAFPKIPRFKRQVTITEKIDGTNAQIAISDDGYFFTGSRNRWITPESDNYGFSAWAWEHKDELMKLGPGRHYGEWWGQGIQRGYDLTEKHFSLFNVMRWKDVELPECCSLVPLLYVGAPDDLTGAVEYQLNGLEVNGSQAAPGFMRPEGVVVYHSAGKQMYKVTLVGDEMSKGEAEKLGLAV